MIDVVGRENIETILELADTAVIQNGYAGVAVHYTTPVGEFEGTIVYFPGVRVTEIFEEVLLEHVEIPGTQDDILLYAKGGGL